MAAVTPPSPLSVFQTEQLTSFLRGNQHPRQNDEVRSALAEVHTQIQCHDASIARLNAKITALKNQRAAWVKQRNKFNSLLSPVRVLPNDILRLIFHQYVGLPWTAPERAPRIWNNQLFVPALVLCGVCSHWNFIVRDSPELWTTIHFNPPGIYDDVDDAQHQAALIQNIVLPRSKDHKLRLHITQSPSYQCPIMAALLMCVHRWGYLLLDIEYYFPDHVLNAMVNNLPCLTELKLFAVDIDYPLEIHPFQTAPNLRALTLDGNSAFDSLFPWDQIRSATIYEDVNAFKDIMEEAISLESLKLQMHRFDEMSGWQDGLASIKELTLCSFAGDEPTREDDYEFQGFGSLSLPALHTLRITSDAFDGDADFYTLFAKFDLFISHSGCSITTLVISRIAFPADDLIALLALLTAVQVFTFFPSLLQDPNIKVAGDKLVLALDVSAADTGRVLLPRLASLNVTVPYLSTDLLVSAVTSRWVPDAAPDDHIACQCLQVVSFEVLCAGLDEELLAPLLHLRSGGLRLNLQDETRFF